MYPPSPPVPGPGAAPGPPPVPPPCPPAAPGPAPATTAPATVPATSGARGTSSGGRSSFSGGRARRSETATAGAAGTSTAAGPATGSVKKLIWGRPAPSFPPPPWPGAPGSRCSSSRPRAMSRTMMSPCTTMETRAPVPSRLRPRGSRRPGRGGRCVGGEGAVTRDRYPTEGRRGEQTHRGAACCAPTVHPGPPSWLLLGRLRRCKADHLHAGAVRDVHRLHHLAVFAVRRRLDEHQLGWARVEDLVEGLVELTHRVGLAVNRIRSIGLELQHDLAGWFLLRLLLLLLGRLDVERLARHRLRDHEDDQQHQQHVDQRRDIDVRAESLATPRGPHRHGSAPFLLLSERLLLLGDRGHHARASLACDLDRLLHAAEFDVLIGFEKQDFVLGAVGVDVLQPGR